MCFGFHVVVFLVVMNNKESMSWKETRGKTRQVGMNQVIIWCRRRTMQAQIESSALMAMQVEKV